eukprot:CAMPEP_0178375862 /NCGR_PEP_ID=MMETSP0689_2-20121128/3109_1 /TAXON_ID=160604 /ORGANISM="Amphidinium massartii, Strain CS-259" /LENGTH=937 /DNA_ID=CAMNT_0019995873 /DNA_START=142 /DNA_END=2956 /DNA_ORIENTATION=+
MDGPGLQWSSSPLYTWLEREVRDRLVELDHKINVLTAAMADVAAAAASKMSSPRSLDAPKSGVHNSHTNHLHTVALEGTMFPRPTPTMTTLMAPRLSSGAVNEDGHSHTNNNHASTVGALDPRHQQQLQQLQQLGRAASANSQEEPRDSAAEAGPENSIINDFEQYSALDEYDADMALSSEDSEEAEPMPFFDAVAEGEEKHVLQSLLHGANPNESFGAFTLKWKEGVLKWNSSGNRRASQQTGYGSDFVDFGAYPDSEYGFKAGVENMDCRFPSSHATIPSGSVSMLKLLINYQADIYKPGTNDANLLWQAAYFGQSTVAEYLLEQGIDIDSPAISQDNSKLRYTPLHAAARAGHYQMVARLLDAKAQVSGKNPSGVTPLEDSIIQSHGDVVRVLVEKGADLVGEGMTWAQRRNNSALSLLFRVGNDAVIGKAAEGLMDAPTEQLDGLTGDDVVRFLKADGIAPIKILQAIMREHAVRYWDTSMSRIHVRTALVDTTYCFNVHSGPHNENMVKYFNSKQTLSPDLMQFIRKLAPPAPASGKWSAKSMLVDVSLFMCHVPVMHGNMAILRALGDCLQDEVFEQPACQVIVQLNWQQIILSANCQMAYQVAYLLLFCAVNIVLQNPSTFSDPLLDAIAWVCVGFWVLEQLLYLAQLCGYWASDLLCRYMFSAGNWLDEVRILAGGGVLVAILRFGCEATDHPEFNAVLGALIFLRWMKVLYSLRPLKVIGLRILPIMSTMLEVWPFFAVLSMFLLGFVNAYYALGIQDFDEAFMTSFKLIAMQEVDLNAMSGVQPEQLIVGDTIETLQPPRRDYYYIVRVLVVLGTFIIGISLMNVLIAVLCTSYQKASSNAWREFIRTRADAAIDNHTIWIGIKAVLACRKLHVAGHTPASVDIESRPAQMSGLPQRENGERWSSYVWYCAPKHLMYKTDSKAVHDH